MKLIETINIFAAIYLCLILSFTKSRSIKINSIQRHEHFCQYKKDLLSLNYNLLTDVLTREFEANLRNLRLQFQIQPAKFNSRMLVQKTKKIDQIFRQDLEFSSAIFECQKFDADAVQLTETCKWLKNIGFYRIRKTIRGDRLVNNNTKRSMLISLDALWHRCNSL